MDAIKYIGCDFSSLGWIYSCRFFMERNYCNVMGKGMYWRMYAPVSRNGPSSLQFTTVLPTRWSLDGIFCYLFASSFVFTLLSDSPSRRCRFLQQVVGCKSFFQNSGTEELETHDFLPNQGVSWFRAPNTPPIKCRFANLCKISLDKSICHIVPIGSVQRDEVCDGVYIGNKGSSL